MGVLFVYFALFSLLIFFPFHLFFPPPLPLTQRFFLLPISFFLISSFSMESEEPRKRTTRACDSCYRRKVILIFSWN